MTFQPPPANTPPNPAGPPPPGGPDRATFDPKSINPLDWGILAAGVLAFIFSLFDYYTVTVSSSGFDASGSVNAWHGFFGWFAALLALAGAVLVALELFVPQVHLPFAGRLIGLGLFAVATLCVVLALFVIPDGDVGDLPGVDTGHGFGYWASLVVIIAGLVLSLMRLQATGGSIPGALGRKVPNIGGYGPQGGARSASDPAPGSQQGQTPPPSSGDGPPAQ
jgi:hypothetical protein